MILKFNLYSYIKMTHNKVCNYSKFKKNKPKLIYKYLGDFLDLCLPKKVIDIILEPFISYK